METCLIASKSCRDMDWTRNLGQGKLLSLPSSCLMTTVCIVDPIMGVVAIDNITIWQISVQNLHYIAKVMKHKHSIQNHKTPTIDLSVNSKS